MIWPWEAEARVDAAEERVRWTEQQLHAAEERLAAAQAAEAEKLKAAAEQLRAAEAEKQKLLDRILQLSGQPKLYDPDPEPAPAPAPAAASSGSVVPSPRRLVDVSDIHAAAREAMANGDFKPKQQHVF